LDPSTSTGNCGVNKAQTTETIKLQSSAKTTITGIKAEFFNGNLMNSSQLNFPNTTSLTYTDPILSSKGCGTYRFRLTLTSPVNMIVDATWVVSH